MPASQEEISNREGGPPWCVNLSPLFQNGSLLVTHEASGSACVRTLMVRGSTHGEASGECGKTPSNFVSNASTAFRLEGLLTIPLPSLMSQLDNYLLIHAKVIVVTEPELASVPL